MTKLEKLIDIPIYNVNKTPFTTKFYFNTSFDDAQTQTSARHILTFLTHFIFIVYKKLIEFNFRNIRQMINKHYVNQ